MLNPTTKITANFFVHEFMRSDTATRLGISNEIPDSMDQNLKRVCEVLERIRSALGKGINILSGYRSDKLNSAVGGSKTSAHCRCLAADIYVNGYSAYELAEAIKPLVQTLGIDQLIYEGTWVHIGLSEGTPRNQLLTATFKGGKVSYATGINR